MTIIDPGYVTEKSAEFASDRHARVAQNAVTTTSVNTLCMDRSVVFGIDETTSERLDAWPVTNQKHSGRCWEFSALNVLRALAIKKYNLEDITFSQNFIAFHDKLEKANHLLTRAIATADRPLDDEEVRDVLEWGSPDGGYWFQFTDLVRKYGLVPGWAMPDTESATNTDQMNASLSTVLRRAICAIRAASTGTDGREASERITAATREGLDAVHRILSIHLGTPPTSFTWQYRDKDKNFHRVGTFTPLEFAAEIVPDGFLEDYVVLTHDPREENPVGRAYVIDGTPWAEGGTPYWHLTAELDDLKKAAVESIREGEPVWFTCDVKKQFDRKQGVWDAHLLDHEAIYGVDMGIDKADRMRMHESSPTHAMALVGVDLVDGVPVRWRVENSWGDEVGSKGFMTMNDSWFDEYVFQVAVSRDRLTDAQRSACEGERMVLPRWDALQGCSSVM